MNRLATLQESLVAELLGEVARLIERVGSLTAELDKAREELRDAAYLLDSRVEPFRHQLAAEVEQTKDIAIKAFTVQTNEIAVQEQRKQRQAMVQAARTILQDELVQPLGRFAVILRDLIDQAGRRWWVWFTHIATAATSALCTAWALFHFFGR
jgi:predicted RNase H-like nuclease (RuvC/YqgF family)